MKKKKKNDNKNNIDNTLTRCAKSRACGKFGNVYDFHCKLQFWFSMYASSYNWKWTSVKIENMKCICYSWFFFFYSVFDRWNLILSHVDLHRKKKKRLLFQFVKYENGKHLTHTEWNIKQNYYTVSILTCQSLRTIRKHHQKEYRRQPWFWKILIFLLLYEIFLSFVVVYFCFKKKGLTCYFYFWLVYYYYTFATRIVATVKMNCNIMSLGMIPGVWICLYCLFAVAHKCRPDSQKHRFPFIDALI